MTRITPEEYWEARRRATAGQRYDGRARFLSLNTNYVDTQPGFGIVWEVNPTD